MFAGRNLVRALVLVTAVAVVGSTSLAVAAAQQDPQKQTVRVGGTVKEPKKIKDVAPVYPEEAKANKIQGVVIVEALIGTDGKVKEAKVLRPVPVLEKAALEAVQQWEYTPTLLNGEPVEVIMTITVNFTLK